jgi:hypothetical protein
MELGFCSSGQFLGTNPCSAPQVMFANAMVTLLHRFPEIGTHVLLQDSMDPGDHPLTLTVTVVNSCYSQTAVDVKASHLLYNCCNCDCDPRDDTRN